MRLLASLLLSLAVLSPQAAMANPADELGNCLKDNTTGKERKELARWVFLSISVHPDIRADSSATEATRIAANKRMAVLVTQLLTDKCAVQTKAAAKVNAGAAMQQAFRLLGEVAMQELMSDKEVTKSVQGFTQYLDQKKFEAVLGK